MRAALLALALLIPSPASAQTTAPSAGATVQEGTGLYPDGVTVRARDDGFYYADARGMTLYALDQRIASGRTGTPSYCVGPCTKVWSPYAAGAGAKPIGAWTIVPGPSGPQWAFKRKPVFLYAADAKPGDVAGDNYDDLFAVIEHVPPPPKLTAPATVAPLYLKRKYVLSDIAGRMLFTAQSACSDCIPFTAGMAARDIGEWTVLRGAERQQWAFRGKPVFVSRDDAPLLVPAEGHALQP